MIKRFILQLQFMLSIPIPVKVEFNEKDFAGSVVFYPVTGALIGGLLALFYYGLNFVVSLKGAPGVGEYLLYAILILTAEIILTGGLHLDGLADTYDALFSYRPKDRILEIMRDSRIGTNGAIALIILILLKTSLFLTLMDAHIIRYLVIMPVISRMSVVWCAGISRYARDDQGMGKIIVEKTGAGKIIIATLFTLFFTFFIVKLISLVVISVAILFTLIFAAFCKHKIGGVTGDILGALIELSEVIILLTLFFSEMFISIS